MKGPIVIQPPLVAGQLPATATNDNAAAGKVGEFVQGVLAVGSATALVSATAKTITSISLTAGDWDVSGIFTVVAAASTVLINVIGSISQVNNTLDTTTDRQAQINYGAGIVPNGGASGISIPSVRLSLNATTTIYLVGQSLFTTSTLTGYGAISARRVR